MVAYTREKILRLLKIDFVRFCIVGGTGFVINLVLLSLLHSILEIPIYISQFVGAEVALFSNFLLHHNWTYKNRDVKKSFLTLITQFHASSWPAIIGSTIMVSACVKFLHFNELLALIVASAVALFWNFGWSKFVIWRDVSNKSVEDLIKWSSQS